MNRYQTPAIVLAKRPVSENDLLYLLFTKERGKILARGFGTQKIINLTAGHLLPYLLVDLTLQEKNDRFTIIDARAVQHYERPTMAVVAKLQIITELIDVYTQLNEADLAVWEALGQAAETLLSKNDYPVAFITALVQILGSLGIMPSTDHCVMTGLKINSTDTLWWSGVLGGLVSAETAAKTSSAQPVRYRDSIKLIRAIIREPVLALRLRAPHAAVQEAEQLLLTYIQLLVHKNVQTLPFLHTRSS